MSRNRKQKTENREQKTEKKICLLISVFCLLSAVFCLLSSKGFSQSEFTYDESGRRNPFIPLITPDGRLLKLDRQKGQAGLLVEGIIYDKYSRSCAIVNGLVAGIGDSINGYRVLKIEDEKVLFIKDGQTIEIGLKKEEGE